MRAILFTFILSLSAQLSAETYTDMLFLEIRNDAFGVVSSDRHLTNAISLGYMTEEIPEFLERYFERNGQALRTFEKES